ncbi:MAG: YlxR family protein [Lachnospiraceae bacterium]|nr:YlxR family protein [Lachnospiraceae bacterium]
MSEKKQVLRKCVSCGEMKDKRSLIRIIRTKEGSVFADPTGRQNGRGAYVCRDRSCIENAFKKKALRKALNAEPDEGLMAELLEEIADE